jgi:ATP-binding cassette subfamily F protein uup
VSHDRAFLENTVTQVIAFEGNGVLTEFGGGYDDWQRFTKQRAEAARSEKAQGANSKPKVEPIPASKPAAGKLSFKEAKELAGLPDKIAALETEAAAINHQLADGSLYRSQPEQVKTLQARLQSIDSEMEALMLRWEDLESRS